MQQGKKVTFTVLGGGGEVGANCYQLGIDGQHLLLDCGTHPKRDGLTALPEFGLIRRAPEALLLSHSHVDHCGAIPYLVRQFPQTGIFTTPPTRRLMDRMLHNSVAVMHTIAKERGVAEYPLYEHEDVAAAMHNTVGIDYEIPITLSMDTPVEATFYPAGHVLGSAGILLKTPEHTLFYTGDMCDIDQELLGRNVPLGKDVQVDTLIMESTHGAQDDTEHLPYQEEAERLGEAISGVLRGGGAALIPTFALGRTQEMLNIISRMQEEGKIPEVPIYASGLGRAVYEIYKRFSDYLKPEANLRPLSDFERIGNVWEPEVAKRLVSKPCIIVATSGMMVENTPSSVIAQEMVSQNHHGIFFVGYLDHETLGYHLLNAQPGDALQFTLGMKPVEVKLENIKRFHFSAHAPRQSLQKLIQQLNPKNVVFVHGDTSAIDWMQEHAGKGYRCFTPQIGQTITLEA